MARLEAKKNFFKNASQILGESLKYSSTQIGGDPAARERLAAH